jgi:signal transduction histidine kinase
MKNSILATTSNMNFPDRKFLDLLAFNEKMAELGRISAGIIHEVNTPLSVIISAAQLVMQEEGVPEAALEMVERIHLEAQRLSHMTRGILNFARRNDDCSGEIDICQTIHEVVTLLDYEIKKRSVKVLEEYDDRVPLLPIGGNRLKQVMLNLVMNALQAMGGAGLLTLSCARKADGCTEIRISDTGPGIPPDSVERIFDPFYTTRGEGEGTGLGLYISRNLIEELDGSLTAHCLPGEGTTFTILFPPLAA